MMINIIFMFQIITAINIVVMIIMLLLLITLFRALFIRNKHVRKLDFSNANKDLSTLYGDKLFQMISLQTSSYEDPEVYHNFREIIKELFPLVHSRFKKEKLGPNVIFTYKVDNLHNNVLIVTHIDSQRLDKTFKMTEENIYGSGSFDSKSLFFVVMQSIEEYLTENKKFDFNLTVVMTVDDKSTNDGNEKIVDKFLRQGKFYNLVLEEGIGIIDPTFLNMKSHHALLGIGVTGEVKIRYQISRERNKKELEDFVRHIKVDKIFKSQIDKNARNMLNNFARDMPFIRRLMFSNIWLYRQLIKRYLNNNDAFRVARLLRTFIDYGQIQESESHYYVDFLYEMASHDTTAEIIGLINPYVNKYNIAFEILNHLDPSKVTSIKHAGYKIVEKTIKDTYNGVYVSPYIITKISDRRKLSRVSDCVIRYSPLYYSNEVLNDAYKGNEQVMKKSLYYGVQFYKNLYKECDIKVNSLEKKK